MVAVDPVFGALIGALNGGVGDYDVAVAFGTCAVPAIEDVEARCRTEAAVLRGRSVPTGLGQPGPRVS